jgi:hypothetical protein
MKGDELTEREHSTGDALSLCMNCKGQGCKGCKGKGVIRVVKKGPKRDN